MGILLAFIGFTVKGESTLDFGLRVTGDTIRSGFGMTQYLGLVSRVMHFGRLRAIGFIELKLGALVLCKAIYVGNGFGA